MKNESDVARVNISVEYVLNCTQGYTPNHDKTVWYSVYLMYFIFIYIYSCPLSNLRFGHSESKHNGRFLDRNIKYKLKY